jgi:hypothetical protein
MANGSLDEKLFYPNKTKQFKLDTKRIFIIFGIILFIVNTAFVFAITEDEYNLAYKMGYVEGFSKGKPGRTHGFGGYNPSGAATRQYPGKSTDPDIKALRNAYSAGFTQGFDDACAGKENRYLY